jgi:hypothetical protein
MEEILSPEFVGWIVTFICMVLSIRFATAFLQENPRLFTAMALFASAWALVLSFYAISYNLRRLHALPEYPQLPANIKQLLNDLPDLDNNLAFFLFVYIGGLLFLQSEAESAPRRPIHIVFIQRLALGLLVFIAVPKVFEFPVPTGANPPLTLDQTKAVVAGAVGLFGMACLGVGAWSISTTSSQRILLVGVTGFYGCLKVWLVCKRWNHPGPDLSPSLIYLFAAGKLLLTLVLGSIVAHHGMTKLLRAKGPRDWIFHFFWLS